MTEPPTTTTPPAPVPTLEDQLKQLEPRINMHLHQYGLGGDPLAAGQARILASRAIKSYDPAAGASFATWLDRSMQPLSRFKRQRATTVKVPERMQLDNQTLRVAELEFEEKHGRLPDMEELADAAGIPMKRIAAVRKTIRPVVAESAYEGNIPGQVEPDFVDEALSAVWRESDALDRQIIEMKTGFGGRYQPLAPKEVAAKLGLTPVQLTRRSQRLTAKLDELLEELQRT